MRVFSSTHTYSYSWREVSTANWRKYSPWNPCSSHVVGVDTLSRSVDPSTGILRTERLITCRQPCPAWLNTILGNAPNQPPTSYVYETSYVDPAAQRVTMCSENLTWSSILNVRETVVYVPERSGEQRSEERSEDSGKGEIKGKEGEKTRFSQEARITAVCGGWKKIREKIEEASLERFGDNARKGREGFEAVLEMSRRVWERERREREWEREPERDRGEGSRERLVS
ncbi:MAG: hypothetical protein Q9191_008426 [Dirinaria sp. TL-2023a]